MNDVDKIEQVRNLLRMIHEGKPIETIKREFKDILSRVSPWEIPLIEQELIKSGISVDEVAALCDLHVDLFRDFVAGKLEIDNLPEGHPLRTLVEENNKILRDVELLGLYLSGYINSKSDEEKRKYFDGIKNLVLEMFAIKNHFVREQMLLFPYLERLGLTAVPQVLWMKQDEVFFALKELFKFLQSFDGTNIEELKIRVNDFIRTASDMVFRENNIFYPTMATILSDAEWYAVYLQEQKIGYYKIEPKQFKPDVDPIYPYQYKPDKGLLENLPVEVRRIIMKLGLNPDNYEVVRDGDIKLDYGFLSVEELDAMLKALPIEITFVGKDGRTRYFTNTEHQVFVRTPSVIGRKVEFCHPPRSIELVHNIVKSFLNGRTKPYVFWTKIKGRTIRVEYIPVRMNGELIGIMEVVMDLTKIKEVIESGRIPYFRSMTLKQLRETMKKKLQKIGVQQL